MPPFPVHEELDVQNGNTIFKSDDWWKAVVLYKGYRGPEIGVYLWKKQDEDWRREQKYVIRSQSDWEQDKAVIEEFVEEL
jgi:hypothetical protein